MTPGNGEPLTFLRSSSTGRMESLQKAPMAARWQKEILCIEKSVGPVTADDRDNEIRVDNDHDGAGLE